MAETTLAEQMVALHRRLEATLSLQQHAPAAAWRLDDMHLSSAALDDQREDRVEYGEAIQSEALMRGRSLGYDGPDTVRMPSEIGPRAGSVEAAQIMALGALLEHMEALESAQGEAQSRDQGMGY